MSVEQGLVAHLLADSAVTGIVGKRVHPNTIPQGGRLPAIVYSRIASVRDVDLDGPTPLIRVRLQVDCWHTSYANVKTLADAVRAALNGVGLSSPRLLGAEPVQMVFLESDADLSEFDGDRIDYRVSQDWIVIHLET